MQVIRYQERRPGKQSRKGQALQHDTYDTPNYHCVFPTATMDTASLGWTEG